jgi:hypothetical protein
MKISQKLKISFVWNFNKTLIQHQVFTEFLKNENKSKTKNFICIKLELNPNKN